LIFDVDDSEVDLDRYELRREGAVVPTEPQVFDLLTLLLRQRHRVVTKEEILDEIWGDRFVS
jgi:DNA-binding winged helix-turn-helix (wHTH) protein